MPVLLVIRSLSPRSGSRRSGFSAPYHNRQLSSSVFKRSSAGGGSCRGQRPSLEGYSRGTAAHARGARRPRCCLRSLSAITRQHRADEAHIGGERSVDVLVQSLRDRGHCAPPRQGYCVRASKDLWPGPASRREVSGLRRAGAAAPGARSILRGGGSQC